MKEWNTDECLAEIQPQLAELEALRQSCLEKARAARKRGLMIGGVLLAVIGLPGLLSGNPVLVVLGIGLALVIGLVSGQSTASADYRAAVKGDVMPKLLRRVAKGMAFDGNSGIPQEVFESTGLYRTRADRYSSEDLFYGTVGRTKVHFAEIHAEEKRTRTDSEGRRKTYWVTIFKGVMVVADFHKHFRQPVLVQSDSEAGIFGWMNKKVQGMSKRVQRMENEDFEKVFKVVADDPVEARYVITPKMQENLLRLRSRLGKGLQAAFRGENAWITIPTQRNWFELDLKTHAADREQMTTLLSEIWSCLSIVEELDLNERVWTKE